MTDFDDIDGANAKLKELTKRVTDYEILAHLAFVSPEVRERYIDRVVIPLGNLSKTFDQAVSATSDTLPATLKNKYQRDIAGEMSKLDGFMSNGVDAMLAELKSVSQATHEASTRLTPDTYLESVADAASYTAPIASAIFNEMPWLGDTDEVITELTKRLQKTISDGKFQEELDATTNELNAIHQEFPRAAVSPALNSAASEVMDMLGDMQEQAATPTKREWKK